MNCTRQQLLLYAVTDRHWLGEKSLYQVVEESLQGGATFIQLREKQLDRPAFLQEAKESKTLCRRYGVPFVIDDDVDLALEVDADGVHVGQSDMEAGNVREKLGPDKIVGVSARTVEQALLAQQRGADYLGVGAVFPSPTKKNAVRITVEQLRDICGSVTIPAVAIGGISLDNIRELRGGGMRGVAVISALFGADDIAGAARTLKQEALSAVTR